MKALISSAQTIRLDNIDTPTPGPGQVRVKLKAAALNHRDLRLARTREDATPVVLGSDGAGVLDAVGSDVDLSATGLQVGSDVVINPSLGWLDEPDAPPAGYQILGDPSNGTLAEYVVVPVENVEPKPGNLSWEEAAAFPLAGLTAYRAVVTRGRVDAGQVVVIPGIGGGVATFALQIAKARGAKVFVTSRSAQKLQAARELGADEGFSSDDEWHRQVRSATGGPGADVVIESVGVPTWNKSIASLKPGGRLVSFAAAPTELGAEAEVSINIRYVFQRHLSILGTAMGNREEFRQLIRMIEENDIRPVIDTVMPFDQVQQAFERMEAGQQFGKIVLKFE